MLKKKKKPACFKKRYDVKSYFGIPKKTFHLKTVLKYLQNDDLIQ